MREPMILKAGEGAYLNDSFIERERPCDGPKHRNRPLLGLLQVSSAELERDGEFIAAQAGNDGVWAELVV